MHARRSHAAGTEAPEAARTDTVHDAFGEHRARRIMRAEKRTLKTRSVVICRYPLGHKPTLRGRTRSRRVQLSLTAVLDEVGDELSHGNDMHAYRMKRP